MNTTLTDSNENENLDCDPEEYSPEYAETVYENLTVDFQTAAVLSTSIASVPCYYSLIGGMMYVDKYVRREDVQSNLELAAIWIQRENSVKSWGTRWLTLPRSQDEMLVVESLTCNCPSENESLVHKKARISARTSRGYLYEGEIQVGFELMIKCLDVFQVLHAEEGSAVGRLRYHQLPDRQLWPQSLHDLLPHGPRATLHSITAWFNRPIPRKHLHLRTRWLVALNQLFVMTYSVLNSFALQDPQLLHGIAAVVEAVCSCLSDTAMLYKPRQRYDHPMWALDQVAGILTNLKTYSMRPVLQQFMKIDEEALISCCARGYTAVCWLSTEQICEDID